MSGRDKWFIPSIVKAVDERLERNLNKVGVFLQSEVVQSFGSPAAYPEGGVRVKNFGKAGTHRQSQKNFREAQHSAPGEPPFAQHGTLKRSITFEVVDYKTLLLGSSLQPQGSEHSYAWYLEMGSPQGQLAARPYLRPAIRNNKAMINKLLASR